MLSLRLLFPACLVVVTSFGQDQLAPVPSDPLELATGPVQIADTPDKRAAILALLERARQNDNLHAPAGSPFDLKVSFVSSGQTSYAGPGEMEEVWVTPGTWRWTARLGDYSQSRIYYHGSAYDTNAHAYLPLRLQMVRSAIFWPVSGNFADMLIRTAVASWKGAPVTCALISGTRSEVTAAPGRRWQEEEFCVDPKSGLLQTYSVAPGIYNVYDYSNAFQFHGSVIARQISIVENGNPVVQMQLESLLDAGAVDSASFTPTAEMQGPGVVIRGPLRFPQFVPNAQTTAGTIQPVIVHAVLDITGKVLEAESLDIANASLSEAALQLVKSGNYGPPATRGLTPVQREVFINVQFVAQQPAN
jgi:hypothetical protein